MLQTDVIRRPAVAGYCYPADPVELRAQLSAWVRAGEAQQEARAVIVPHGSYRQSGSVAASTMGHVSIPRRCVILGPSHTGAGMRWSLMSAGAYRTPLGDVPIDEPCAQRLRERCPFLELDGSGQQGEHAIEVQLPLLQHLGPHDLSIIPIVMGRTEPAEWQQMAEGLVEISRALDAPPLFVASADLSQYQSHERGASHDVALLQAIRSLSVPALVQAIGGVSALMCGYEAVVCVLEAARQMGAREAELVSYGTSRETGGDPDSVTGYAGLVIR